MIKIKTKFQLKHSPTDQLIYVITTKKLYRNIDGEWIEKVYFSSDEIAAIIGITPEKVRTIVRQLSLRQKSMRSCRINQVQLRIIAEASRQVSQDKTYVEIKKDLKL